MQARADEVARLAGLSPKESLVVLRDPREPSVVDERVLPGITRYRRYFDGLEVIGGDIDVETDLSGTITNLQVKRKDIAVRDTEPSCSAELATRVAMVYSELPNPVAAEKKLMIFAAESAHPDISFEHPMLIWRVHLRSPHNVNEHVLVHAHTGHFLLRCQLDAIHGPVPHAGAAKDFTKTWRP